MSILSRLFGKASPALGMVQVHRPGEPVNTPRNYKQFSENGFQRNVIAFNCVSRIARAAAGIPILLYRKRPGGKDEEVTDHPLLNLIEKPNPMQGQFAFVESTIAYFMIAGNSYIECVRPGRNDLPRELWVHRPDLIRVLAGGMGLPGGYLLKQGSKQHIWPVDPITGESAVMHMKTFNPLDSTYGMSPIEAAIYSVDQHNEAARWNLSLLQNKAMPSGALKISASTSNPGAKLTDEQFNRLKQQLRDDHAGARNAGTPLLLEGGMEWQSMSFSPSDMDWINGKHTSARDIALAFSVPPILLNIPGDSTFANYREARQAFYEDTVIPIHQSFMWALNTWLCPVFGEDLYFQADMDSVEALALKRESQWNRIQASTFLTINEKREAVGYGPVEGGNVLLVPGGNIPLEDAGLSLTPPPANDEPAEDEEEEPTEEETEPEEETTEEEDQEAASADMQNERKLLNLQSATEKRRLWMITQRKRASFENRLSANVKSFFDAEKNELANALKETKDKRIAEIIANHVIEGNRKKLQELLERHIYVVTLEFGADVFESGKDDGMLGAETKAQNRVRFEDAVRRFAASNSGVKVTGIAETSRKKVVKSIQKAHAEWVTSGEGLPKFAEAIKDSYEGFSASRSVMIARTETTIASNHGSLVAAKSLGLPDMQKEWISVQDERTRGQDGDDSTNHAAMNGARVGINEKFSVLRNDGSPDDMEGPGDPSAPVEQVVNCRCVMTYTSKSDSTGSDQ
jgi:HK97 family phage portal protein